MKNLYSLVKSAYFRQYLMLRIPRVQRKSVLKACNKAFLRICLTSGWWVASSEEWRPRTIHWLPGAGIEAGHIPQPLRHKACWIMPAMTEFNNTFQMYLLFSLIGYKHLQAFSLQIKSSHKKKASSYIRETLWLRRSWLVFQMSGFKIRNQKVCQVV